MELGSCAIWCNFIDMALVVLEKRLMEINAIEYPKGQIQVFGNMGCEVHFYIIENWVQSQNSQKEIIRIRTTI